MFISIPLPLTVANGGTGSGTAAGARTNLGLDTPTETSLTLAVGWSTLSSFTPAYRKAANGWVSLQGTANGGASATTLIATLPAGYRPAYRRFFAVVANSVFGVIFVEPDGTINTSVGSTLTFFTLDGIGFFV